jgi:hypothetical protein
MAMECSNSRASASPCCAGSHEGLFLSLMNIDIDAAICNLPPRALQCLQTIVSTSERVICVVFALLCVCSKRCGVNVVC